MALAFMCCCAPNAAGNEETTNTHSVDATREVTGDGNQAVAGMLGKTATPNFPAPVRTPRQDERAKPGDKKMGLSPREKEQEKARLQEIVKDFSRKAVGGILVQVVDPDSLEALPQVLSMDKYLYTFTLGNEGVDDPALSKVFNMKDMTAIYKGPDVEAKAPNLSSIAQNVVGIDISTPPNSRLFFNFKESGDRDKFYTCIKILRMSVDIHQK